MRRILVAFSALGLLALSANAQELQPPPVAQLAPSASPATLLPVLIEHSRHTARIENGRLVGDGAMFLRELGANSHFLLMGETHGTAEVAQFATAYWRDLNAAGYQYGAVEADPYIAAALERELRAGGVDQWGRYIAAHGGEAGAPFFTWVQESEWTAEIVRPSDARTPVLWGLDQAFIGAAPWHLRELAEHAQSREARAFAAQLLQRPEWQPENVIAHSFVTGEITDLQRLRTLLNGRRDAHWAEMVDSMIVSHRIYQPFVTGQGEALIANDEREILMKRLFQAHYEAASREEGPPPRVMFKFGATHMYRGPSMTQVNGLGGFVTEFAAAHNLRAASVLVVCGRDGQAARLIGGPVSCADDFNEFGLEAIEDYLSPTELTVFDLRVWRLRYRRWAHLPANFQRMVSSFDALVVIPGGQPAQVIPGLPSLPPPPAPGG